MRSKTRRLIYVAALLGAAAALALLLGTNEQARADSPGTPTTVGAFNCIVVNGGHVTRPAGSTIVIHQGIAEQARGILADFLAGQTTLVSASDAQMVDVSDQWSDPVQQPSGYWSSAVEYPTGVTLEQPGDQMRFTFSEVVGGPVPEAAFGPGQPAFNGPGLAFGGTCTVTAS
jgi:hypothetical protein